MKKAKGTSYRDKIKKAKGTKIKKLKGQAKGSASKLKGQDQNS